MRPAILALALLLCGFSLTVKGAQREAARDTRREVMECVASMEPATPADWRFALEGCTL